MVSYTAIPYRVSTGPEQGKTCFHYRGPLFSLQGPLFSLQGFPCEKTSQGKPCFHYREWVCSVGQNFLKLRRQESWPFRPNPARIHKNLPTRDFSIMTLFPGRRITQDLLASQ